MYRQLDHERDGYAMYLRKSRGEGDIHETLEDHETRLRKIASEKGYRIVAVYREVVSGETIESRPEMLRLLDDVYEEKFYGVLCHEVERLARGNTKDQGIVEEAFMITNTKIITPQKTYDPSNEADENFFAFGLFMSRQEFKTIRKRMKAGTQSALEKGIYLGTYPPYGYDKVTVNKMKTLAKNENAKVVEMIFDLWIDERLTKFAIAKKLTLMGIPAPRGSEWDYYHIVEIIKNPVYAGKIRWRNRKRVKTIENGKMVKRQIRNPNPDIYDGLHEAIIPMERFELAQTLFVKHAPIKDKMKFTNPLAGIMKCPKCGGTIRINRGRKIKDYRFSHPQRILCTTKSMKVEEVLDVFVNSLKQYIHDFEIKLNNSNEQEEIKKHEEMIVAMKEKLVKLNAKRNQLFDYFERGIYTEDEFLERKGELIRNIDKQENEIADAELHTPKKIDYQERIVKFHKVIDLIKDDPYDNAEEINQLLREFISVIHYSCEDLGRSKGGIIDLKIFFK